MTLKDETANENKTITQVNIEEKEIKMNEIKRTEENKPYTDAELALIAIKYENILERERYQEGDECLIADILQVMKASGRTTRHCLFLLDKAKDVLEYTSLPPR